MSRCYAFRTVDVFTDVRFGGNQLAVFTDAEGLSDAEMQALAAEMNLSETSFVLPPADPANDARVRIFNRTAEMPFAGHPNVGTAYVLAQLRPGRDRFRFEELAGLVEVRLDAAGGAEVDAPQPLSLLGEVPPVTVARALGLNAADVLITAHPPVRASVGVEFVLAEVSEEALARAAPDLAGFRQGAAEAASDADRFSIFFYCRPASGPLRARMFAPLSGTWEDPATGGANVALAALRLSLSSDPELSYEVLQGVEMGRSSRLSVRAWRDGDGIRAAVGGRCVPVLEGAATL
jgi:trans-2,3-dihydro-3-hydroxyanthranilate isomerase